MYRVSALISVLLACASAQAVTLQQLSMEEMAQNATSIVRARVTGSSAGLSGSTIYTHYRLQVSETWKGAALNEVMVPGGSVGLTRQSFPGVPDLTTGNEYILFLWTSSTGITHLLGLQQGVFNVTGTNDASSIAVRARIGELMLDSAGHRVPDQPLQLKVSDLRSRVSRAAITGRAR